jgi:hypothetical protein
MKIFSIVFFIAIFSNLNNTFVADSMVAVSLLTSQNLIKSISLDNKFTNDLKPLSKQPNNFEIEIKAKPKRKLNFMKNCPKTCSCQGFSVDCSYKALSLIPKNIPRTTIKL